MNTISTIQKQHRVRSIIKIIIYACLGALFLYGAIHKYIDRLGEAAATSIIGGADGPTSVFFAGKLGQTNLHRNRNGFLLYGVLAAGLLIYALYNLVLLIKEAYLKRLRNDLSNYKISEYDLDSDFSDSNQFYHVSFGKRFFLYAGKEPFVIPYDRIIWAFVKTKRRRVTSISPASFANYFVYIYDDEKTLRKFKVVKEDPARDILAELKLHAPNAFYGYSPEYYNRYSCFYDEMVEEVQRKNINV